MAVRIVRLGTRRAAREGLRIGTVRRPPRGVRKADYARRDYYDAWLPELAPSAPLVSYALSKPWTSARWARYARRYRGEMAEPAARRLIATVTPATTRNERLLALLVEVAQWPLPRLARLGRARPTGASSKDL